MQKIIDKPDTDIDTEPEEEVEEPKSSKKGANVDKLPFIVNDSILRSSEGHTDESSSFHTPPSFNTPPTLSLAESTKNDVIQGMEFSIITFKIFCIHFSFIIFTMNLQNISSKGHMISKRFSQCVERNLKKVVKNTKKSFAG